MEPTRREFMRQVGVFLAGWLASGCAASRTPEPTPMMTCYQPTAIPVTPTLKPSPTLTCYTPTPAPTPTPQANDARWSALRASWLELKNPQLQTYEDTDFSRHLSQQHAEALTALTEAGLLDAAVAADIQVAFDQAVAHVQRQQATCYIALPPEYTPRQEVLTQTAALTEMAQRSDINPATVERARAALARDMAWLAQFQAGEKPDDLADIQATPTEIRAARILVDLLLAAN
ncbi:hypothetical protein TFLX_05197 [Thermoflexales bacterium]|nr:hypothetical protein TFLX_05197 [Thermoflexales bacterium]